ncbi:hypothetical protein NDU88_003379 [Pleurodeles waltl]|uniref:Uncharacterized protein n=1 Tax=Pleurodeles waltl TaxID=8319 RepID=A0AAV7V0E6_PLEWA|nr:hypothetical protein NDU88_003379 [Pleurodeles waltl]
MPRDAEPAGTRLRRDAIPKGSLTPPVNSPGTEGAGAVRLCTNSRRRAARTGSIPVRQRQREAQAPRLQANPSQEKSGDTNPKIPGGAAERGRAGEGLPGQWVRGEGRRHRAELLRWQQTLRLRGAGRAPLYSLSPRSSYIFPPKLAGGPSERGGAGGAGPAYWLQRRSRGGVRHTGSRARPARRPCGSKALTHS